MTNSQAYIEPFDVTLENQPPLKVYETVRLLPGRRLVGRGVWQERPVFVKIFYGKNAAKYAARDARGVGLLQAANITTPALLFHGKSALEPAWILVFEAIENAENAEVIYENLSEKPQERRALATQLVQVVAHLHTAGLIQTDMYLKNFLVQDDVVYSLDGDGIRPLSVCSITRQMQRNLATLLSKLDVLDDHWMPDFYKAYCKKSGSTYSVFNEAEILTLTRKIRRQAASNYADVKVFRTCTDVKKYALKDPSILAASAYNNLPLPQIIDEMDVILEAGTRLKSGNTCTVALAEIGENNVVIKRYNIKNFWHGLSRAFRQTRAAVSWANAHRLILLGIATARPVALLEAKKFGLFRGKAYFLSEYVDAPDVAQFFTQTRDKKLRAEAVKNIVELFYKLFLLQISHNDTKATNIKMRGTEPVLIDLDAMRQHATNFRSSVAHLRDLQRFMQNWDNDKALYNAFVKTFKVVYPDTSILIKAGIFQNKELTE